MEDLPIACTLTDDALRARKSGLLAQIAILATNRAKLTAGYRLEFPPTSEALTRITAMIDAERQCYTFLRFTPTVESNPGAIALEFSGPEGTREFLEALFEPA
jgi:hypothetical protein